MIHNLTSPSPRTLSTAPKGVQSPPPGPPEGTPPQDSLGPGVLARVGGTVVGAGAGAAGLVYGGSKGLVHGARQVPSTVVEGANLGTKVVEPLTRTAGAVAAVALTGLTGLGVAGAIVLGPVVGMGVGTVQGASAKGLTMVKGAARTAASAGVQVGSATLGAVGGALGALVGLCTLPTLLYPPFGMKVVPQAVRGGASAGFKAGQVGGRYLGGAIGGTLGALGGAVSTVASGLPQGVQQATLAAKQTVPLLKTVPTSARELWAAGQSGGKLVAQATGGTVGAVGGVGAGILNTGIQGLAEGVQTAAQWGHSGYQAVAGPKKPD